MIAASAPKDEEASLAPRPEPAPLAQKTKARRRSLELAPAAPPKLAPEVASAELAPADRPKTTNGAGELERARAISEASAEELKAARAPRETSAEELKTARTADELKAARAPNEANAAEKSARAASAADAAEKAARAPGETSAEELKTARAAKELKTAREVIDTDAPRAAEIAERVLSRGAPAELEAEALAVLADAERHRGRFGAAAVLYGKLRDHPRARGYAEEAMLQRAQMLEQLRDLDAALAELARLEKRHPRGVTAPERAALAAKIYLAKADPQRAARAILAVSFEGRSRALEKRRAEVARALEKIDPALAKKLMASKPAGDHSSEANR